MVPEIASITMRIICPNSLCVAIACQRVIYFWQRILNSITNVYFIIYFQMLWLQMDRVYFTISHHFNGLAYKQTYRRFNITPLRYWEYTSHMYWVTTISISHKESCNRVLLNRSVSGPLHFSKGDWMIRYLYLTIEYN